jgi:hypothetical protein
MGDSAPNNGDHAKLSCLVMKPVFFATPASFRVCLSKHHGQRSELWVGFYKRDSGKPSITWPESVDEALCFGWIDGIRKSLGDESYVIRFAPRKPRSTWSAVNIKRAKELVARGRMSPAGLRAFAARSDDRSAIYSYEQRTHAQLESRTSICDPERSRPVSPRLHLTHRLQLGEDAGEGRLLAYFGLAASSW